MTHPELCQRTEDVLADDHFLPSPSVPSAAFVPVAVGFPLSIHSKHTAIRAPRIGPTM